MINLLYIFGIVFIQISSAQVITYNPRNGMQANPVQGNQIQNGHNHLNPLVTNVNGLHLTRTNSQYQPNNVQVSNNNVAPNANYNPLLNANIANKFNTPMANREIANAKYANTQIANAELANAKLSNAQIANELANNYANSQIANVEMANAKLANAQAANAEFVHQNYRNVQLENEELQKRNYANAELANARLNAQNAELSNARIMQSNANNWLNNNIVNTANANAKGDSFATTNFANSPVSMWALNNLASINGNTATFNVGTGNGGQIFTITSGSPNSPAFGIQLLAEALEIGGTVAVNGHMPIYGTVAVNGNLPTDGSASVSYSSGRQVRT